MGQLRIVRKKNQGKEKKALKKAKVDCQGD
jgi:hypothetical protein